MGILAATKLHLVILIHISSYWSKNDNMNQCIENNDVFCQCLFKNTFIFMFNIYLLRIQLRLTNLKIYL